MNDQRTPHAIFAYPEILKNAELIPDGHVDTWDDWNALLKKLGSTPERVVAEVTPEFFDTWHIGYPILRDCLCVVVVGRACMVSFLSKEEYYKTYWR